MNVTQLERDGILKIDGYSAFGFLSEERSQVQRIESIESSIVYKSFEIKVPFVADATDKEEPAQ